MDDFVCYLFCITFFILGFCLAVAIIVGWRRQAVDESRMMVKSGDTWKGTLAAAEEFAFQLGYKLEKREIEKEHENVN
jgi:hypothetical protein